jgi:lipopolysaccharide export system protein LptA
MTAIGRLGRILVLATALGAAPALAAPQPKGPPNALQGFSQNRDQPVQIEATTLEVRDKDKQATFSGDVRVKQGDTSMRCKSLVVFYEGGPGAAAASSKTLTAAKPGPGGEQRIKRLEARGGVVVKQKDQTASGNLGIFDMRTNTVTLTGNVVMTQGKNVLRGERLVVNLTSGVSRVESGKNGSGRVQGLFMPGKGTPRIAPGLNGGYAPPAPAPAPPTPIRPIH